MIHGKLNTPESHAFLLDNPAWKLAFDWLHTVTPATPLGITQLQGEDIYVNVMTYQTLPAEQCRYETHRKYVDLQYTITGAEMIDWLDRSELLPDGGFDEAKDLQFYQPVPTLSRVHMLPGCFAIFYPTDAHRPKVSDTRHGEVFKLVVKMNLKLVS
ncbi:Toxin-antitoxin biofilm protein TabA [Lacunisphaera limnophila]|uniref:Toxin-antitoxin biofilm protein TabA n=1 Tax=Lacunisphaera limnophila TaxID=1838286 RepID=A0A1D8AYC1_9BACT|nr:YhcH/YjgK/YiaL family protein [Lacunisphaera limnophila]AOS45899.1 Toxin-antitoxin biofilm protein TabA [Lacunisphaera limnophila]